jgi:cell division protease FtsH
MSERLGGVAYDRDPRAFLAGPDLPMHPREQDYGEKTATAIDDEVRSLVHHAMDRAIAILNDKRDILERSARRLLETETLDEKELTTLIGPPVGPPFKAAAE